MNSIVSIIIGLLIIIGVGGSVYYEANKDDVQPAPIDSGTPTTGGSQPMNTASGLDDDADDDGDDDDDDAEDAAPAAEGTGAAGGTNTPASGGYTDAEVAQHSSRSSCWSIINGNVYDLTSWIPKHPGGEQAILNICGKDGSSKFNGQHGGAATQAQILAGFKIGTLNLNQ